MTWLAVAIEMISQFSRARSPTLASREFASTEAVRYWNGIGPGTGSAYDNAGGAVKSALPRRIPNAIRIAARIVVRAACMMGSLQRWFGLTLSHPARRDIYCSRLGHLAERDGNINREAVFRTRPRSARGHRGHGLCRACCRLFRRRRR